MRKEDTPYGGILFEEQQRFPQWLSWLLIGPTFVLVSIILIMGLTGNMERTEMFLALAIVVPLDVSLFLLFRFVQLEKVVTRTGIFFRWPPLQKNYRMIPREEIASLSVRKGPAFKYGWNKVPGYGTVRQVSDGEGVQLELTNGGKLFFGTAELIYFERSLNEMIRGRNLVNEPS